MNLSDYRFWELSREAMGDLVATLPDSSPAHILAGVDGASQHVNMAEKTLEAARRNHDLAVSERAKAVRAAMQRIEREWTQDEIAKAIESYDPEACA